MTSPTTKPEAHHAGELPLDAHLAQPRLGVAGLVFLIVAASAPLTVLAGSVPTNFAVSGLLEVPLGYLTLALILGFFAVGYGAMSSSITNAGAFYAYVTAGLGVRQGIGAAVLALVSYNAMQIGLYGLFGFSLGSFMSARLGIEAPWWLWALLGLLLVGLLGVMRLDLSVKLVAVLVTGEFLIAIIADVVAIGVAPEGLSAAPLNPGDMFTGGFGAVLAFGIASFMGFESGAIYSEETKDPERTVGRATYIAIALVGGFYAFCAWALAMGIGPSAVIGRSQELGPDLVFAFLSEHTNPILVDLANLLFISSLLAALLVFHNAAARYFFALGRPGVLPTWFARTSTRTGAPVAGSLAQTILAVLVVAIFAVFGAGHETGDLYPVITLFTWLTNAAAFGLVFLLTVTAVAVIGYFRTRPGEHGVFVRIIAPAIATIGLGGVFVLILANFDVLIGAEADARLVVVMPALILASGVVGLARGEYLRRRRPESFDAAAHALDHQ